MLQGAIQFLWAADKYDAELMKGATPLEMEARSDFRPHRPQYTLRPDAAEGLQSITEHLLADSIIVLCPDSPCHTALFL